MKTLNKLKIVLVILVVILLSLVSFGGIYYKSKNDMMNRIPGYSMGTDLKGYRQITLEVKKASTDTDAENETEDSDESKSETDAETKNDEEKNAEEDSLEEKKEYSSDDYKKSAKVISDRMKSLKVENFSVSCDENTGMITVSLPENDQTDIILSDITQIGEFLIKDTNTKENLLTNKDVSKVEIGTRTAGSTKETYMNIHFTNSGASKFAKVTKEYQNEVIEENTTVENKNEENAVTTENEESTEKEEKSNETAENKDDATGEEKTASETKTKKVDLAIDGNNLMTTSFDAIIDNGILALTLGTSTLEENNDDALYSAYNLGAIIENEAMPVEYEVTSNSYIASVIKQNQINAIIYTEIGLGLILLLILIAKYKINGIITSVTSIGFLAILLIVIRFANVAISLEGFFAIAISFIINYALNIILCNYLSKENLTQEKQKTEFIKLVKKYTIILMPELIFSIICCFTMWEQLLSLGMIVFWGIVIGWIYNIILAKVLEK